MGASVLAWLCAACSDDGVPADGEGTDGDATSAASTVALEGSAGSPTSGEASGGPLDGDTTAATQDTAAETTGGVPGGSAGCSIPYAGEPVVEGTIDVDGTPRTFVLSVPAGYDPNVPTTLVFAWHGLGGDGALARLYFGVEQASAGQAIFVYPDALPLASMGGQTGWELVDGGSDVRFFDTLLAEFSANLCIDPDRVFSTGHSFGGYMSNALGCFRADVLRAIAPVAGGPPFGACQDARVAAWMTHGTADAVVPFAQGQAALDSVLGRNECGTESAAVAPDPCVAYDGCDPDHPVTWCPHDIADQSGHLWPPFAADAIWAFFTGLAPSASP